MLKPAPCFRLLIASGLIFLSAMLPVFGAGFKQLHGHVPEVVAALSPEGNLPATNQLRLAIGLPLRHTEELAGFITQLYDPASPGFHQYLTQAEFAERFGPTAQDYEMVKVFARTNGLNIVATSQNRLLLDVTGPVAAVEKALHIKMRKYRHPTEARDFYAPDAEPSVAVELPVVDVQGLSDFSRPHPKFTRRKAVSAKPKIGSAPDGSGDFFGNDFRNAYASGVTLTGAGQSVGLFEADGFYASDIAAYAAAAGNGRTNILIQTVLVDSFNGTPTTGVNSGETEVALDIEMAMAMAPGLTRIVVVEGNPNNYIPNDILNAMLSLNVTVKNLSSSWGWRGGPSTTTDNIFTNMAAVGQTYFNASGDSDAFTTGSSSANGVDRTSLYNAPSSSPIITQVGGTTLSMNGSGASYASETVWNWGGGTGSSGGISSHYAIPSWQTSVSNLTARGGSATLRNIPDVAAVADEIFVKDGNGMNDDGIGGTSCAAPLWAGFIALVNQQAAANGKPSVGFINPALYSLAAGTGYAASFHDVTTGNNTWSKSKTLFYATNGYDLCTGLGTPAGGSLINALAGSQALIVSPLSGGAVGVGGGPFSITNGNYVLTNTGASSVTWTLINTSSWIAFSATNGTLAAGAQTTVTASLTSAASNLVAGSYTANLLFSNVTAQIAQAAAFSLRVNQPLVVSPTNAISVAGPVGGPFGGISQNYTLTNLSVSPVSWGTLVTSPWLGAAPANGVLAGGGQTVITVSLTPAAASLDAGVYGADLLVTNTSSLAAVLVFNFTAVSPPVFQAAQAGSATFDLTWSTVAGLTYQLQYSADLTQSNWVNLGDAQTAGSTTITFSDTNVTASPQRFYRVVVQP